jgi:hypothetical protein
MSQTNRTMIILDEYEVKTKIQENIQKILDVRIIFPID